MLRRIVAGLGANLYEKLIVSAVQLLLVPVLSLHWGLSAYGAWLLLATIPSFLSMSDLGFATAAGTKMTMLASVGERIQANRVFQSACAMILGSTVIVVVLLLSLVCMLPGGVFPSAAGFPAEEARTTLCALIVYGILSLQGSILNAGFRASGRYAFSVLWMANTALAEACTTVAIVAWGGRPLHAALGMLCIRCLSILVQSQVLRRKVDWLHLGLGNATRAEVRVLVQPALSLMAFPVSQAALLQGTALVLGAAAGEAAVPAFTATRTLSRVSLQLTQMVTHSLMPDFSAAVARGDRDGQGQMLVLTMGTALATALPFAAVLLAFGPGIVRAWTYGVINPPHWLMVAISGSILLGGLWNPLASLSIAMNRHSSFALPYVLVTLSALLPAYWLSRELQATGAALSIALVDAAMLVILLWKGHTLFNSAAELRGAAHALRRRGSAMMQRFTSRS